MSNNSFKEYNLICKYIYNIIDTYTVAYFMFLSLIIIITTIIIKSVYADLSS